MNGEDERRNHTPTTLKAQRQSTTSGRAPCVTADMIVAECDYTNKRAKAGWRTFSASLTRDSSPPP